ncbi:MAG: sulfotransferase domain-containing protein [Nocardioides sp.]
MSGTGRRHFLVVGAQRCGTTYLRQLLGEHPQISMATSSSGGEPKVFLTDEVVGRGASWYVDTWFAGAPDGAVLGEKSTSYLEVAAAVDRVAAVLGRPQILVQLRDPVARAVSNWQLSTRHGLETRTLTEALTANLAGPEPWDPARTSVSPYAYLERGRYVDHLRPWHDALGDRVRVQFMEDLLARTHDIAGTYRWLGVHEGFVPPSLGERINPSTGFAPSLGSGLTARLREWFAESDRALVEFVGRPLPWDGAEGST